MMSEERLERIESGVARLTTDVEVLKTDVAVLKTDVAVLKTDVAVLKTDVTVLKTDVADLRGHIDTGLADLRHYMGVLYESTLDHIRAAATPVDALRREMHFADAELREDVDRRVGPLEVVVREHSREIEHLKKRRR